MTLEDLDKYSPAEGRYDLRDQLKQHIYARGAEAFARGDAARDAILTEKQLRERQNAVRRFFINSLGGLPSRNTKLNARTTGRVKGKGYTVENIIFESRPGHYVTVNLYLPSKLSRPTGAVLYICGHARDGRPSKAYQAIFQPLVRAGLIVLVQDTIGQGERFAYYDATTKKAIIDGCSLEHEYAGNQCLPLGDGVARYFLHDALRGIDYLCSRPEVDPKRIGVTGESGGGMHTAMLMMAEPRIAAAAPGLFITSGRAYMPTGGARDAEQIWRGFTAAGFDHEDILLAMAPRPVRVLAAAYDFFPIEGTRRTVQRSKRFWKLAGERCRLDLVEDRCPHSYTPKIVRAMTEFFSRNLLGNTPGKGAYGPAPMFEPEALWVTRSGQVNGEIPGACFVQDANRERLPEIQPSGKPGHERRKWALAWLKRRVFSHRKPTSLNTRCLLQEKIKEISVESLLWWSQEGMLNHALTFRLAKWTKRRLPVVLAIWDEGTLALRPHWSWIRRQCRLGRAVVVLNVSGAGEIKSNPLLSARKIEAAFGTMHKLADDLSWLGDDLAALRIFDVIRALDMITEWPAFSGKGIRVYAHGRQGIYGQFAAALDRRIKQIEVHKGIGSFAKLVRTRYYDAAEIKSVILHGMLRYFDLPDLKHWKAAD